MSGTSFSTSRGRCRTREPRPRLSSPPPVVPSAHGLRDAREGRLFSSADGPPAGAAAHTAGAPGGSSTAGGSARSCRSCWLGSPGWSSRSRTRRRATGTATGRNSGAGERSPGANSLALAPHSPLLVGRRRGLRGATRRSGEAMRARAARPRPQAERLLPVPARVVPLDAPRLPGDDGRVHSRDHRGRNRAAVREPPRLEPARHQGAAGGGGSASRGAPLFA